MARVPIAQPGSGTRLNPLPNAPLVPADLSAGGRMIGEALQRTGQFVQAYADEQEKLDNDIDLAAVKRADVEDAKWLRQQLWEGPDAFYTKQGFNAVNARAPLEAEITKRRAATLASLTTARQRELYSNAAEVRYGSELVGVSRHVINESAREESRASLARVTESSNDAVTSWADPERRELAVATMISEIRGMAATQGWAPDTLARAEKEARTGVTSRIIKTLADTGRIEDSHAYLEAHRDELDPDAAAQLDAGLYRPLLERQAEGIADDLLGTAPTPEAVTVSAEKTGQVLPRMVSITAIAESQGRERDKSGNLITSRAGAQGKMQVMPGTNLDPGFGVTPARDNSDAERTRVGRDYLAAMMKRYGNDPAKAWAAYNWGPGNVDAHLKANGGKLNIDALPRETRLYVRGNLAALGGRGVTAPAQQAPQEHDLNKLLAEVDGLGLPFDVEQAVRRRITERVGLDEGLLRRNREKAEEDALTVVNGLGTNGFTSMSQIPPSIRSRLAPSQIRSFTQIAEQNVRALTQGKETDWQAYSTYSDEVAKDPEGFLRRSPAEIRAKLGDNEFKQVIGWRQMLLAGKGSAKPTEQVTASRIVSVTEPLLLAAGITRPSESKRKTTQGEKLDQEYWQRVGKFKWQVQWEVEHWQSKHPNEQISDTQIQSIASAQLIRMWKDEGGKRTELGFAFEVEPGPNVRAQIGAAQRESIIRQYKQRWGVFPSEAEIWEIARYGPRGGRK